jgi:hypothetical protein
MTSDSLFEMPKNSHTRCANPENWDGARGAAGQANNRRKGSPCFPLKAGEHKVLAHAENSSDTIRRIWLTMNNRSPQMLRGLRIDMYAALDVIGCVNVLAHADCRPVTRCSGWTMYCCPCPR